MKTTVWSKFGSIALCVVLFAGLAVGAVLIAWAWAWFLTLAGKLLPWP